VLKEFELPLENLNLNNTAQIINLDNVTEALILKEFELNNLNEMKHLKNTDNRKHIFDKMSSSL